MTTETADPTTWTSWTHYNAHRIDQATREATRATTRRCHRCGRVLVHRLDWFATPRNQRDHHNQAQLHNKNTCVPCYQRKRRRAAGKPTHEFHRDQEAVVEDWRWIQDDLPHPADTSQQERLRIAAARIGMTPESLEKALRRAGEIGPKATR